jgi:hypothetical protein
MSNVTSGSYKFRPLAFHATLITPQRGESWHGLAAIPTITEIIGPFGPTGRILALGQLLVIFSPYF